MYVQIIPRSPVDPALDSGNYLNITWDTNSHDTKTLPTTGISHRKTFTTHLSNIKTPDPRSRP